MFCRIDSIAMFLLESVGDFIGNVDEDSAAANVPWDGTLATWAKLWAGTWPWRTHNEDVDDSINNLKLFMTTASKTNKILLFDRNRACALLDAFAAVAPTCRAPTLLGDMFAWLAALAAESCSCLFSNTNIKNKKISFIARRCQKQ